jgi:hypothetical protein
MTRTTNVAGLSYIRASDIKQKPIDWLWSNRALRAGRQTAQVGDAVCPQ